MALVVVRDIFHVSQAQRQHGLGSLQRLHLAFLIYAQHQRIVGRVQIQPDDIAQLFNKERIGGQLEALGPVRLDTEQSQITMDATFGDACLRPHRPHAPMRGAVLRLTAQDFANQRGDSLIVAATTAGISG